MKQSRASLVAVLATVCCAAASPLRANSDLVFVPYAEAGIVDYSLGFEGSIPLPGAGQEVFETSNEFNFTLSMLKLGLAASWGDFYANVHLRTTTEGSDVQVTDLELIPGAQSIKWSGDRVEYGLAVGYDVSEAISIFGGYRDSETSGDGAPDSSYSFEHDGYFLGASYFVDLTDTGGLTFSAGYAWLDASLEETVVNFQFPTSTGDGSGGKLAVNWRDLFNERWGYTVAVEYFDYEYDLSARGGLKFDMEEREALFSVGLFYVFR